LPCQYPRRPISGFNDAAKEELSLANERYRNAIERTLVPYEDKIRAHGLTPYQLSDFIQTSAVGFKHKAKNKKHLLELLTSLKVLVLTVAETD
jgi:hypothetical protein